MARVIVIDDQDPIRRIVRRALEQAGHEVLDAADGASGMQILAQHSADVVISDIFMPGQDGIETLRQIRKDFPAVRVIVMSGGDSSGLLDLRQDAELLGAVKSLRKPFTAREIVDAVNGVLKS
ncbi:MAG TPA: response regulator [Gemmatimonadales bacterium]|nr:response regulator [Gemmatimonadales bacterium]